MAGQTVGIGIEGDEAFEEALARGNLGDGLLRVRDAGKRGEGVLAVGAIGEVFLESGLGGDFGAEEFRIMQCGDGTVPGFAGILDTEEFIFGAAGVLGVAVAPVREEDFAALQERELVGKLVIADVFKFRYREEAAGGSGVARNEGEFAVLGTFRGPLEGVRGLNGLAVFVDAEKAHIEVVAGIFEIIGIAAEERDALLRGEDEADVGVFLEAVEVIGAALVESDDVAAEPGLGERFFFDFGGDLAAGEHGGLAGGTDGDRGIYAQGDVFDGLENVELEIDALLFVGRGFRVESVAEIIVFFVGKFLDIVGADMVIGDDETITADEGAGAAVVETNRGQLQPIQKLVSYREPVRLFDSGARELVEEPHAFVGGAGQGQKQDNCGKKQDSTHLAHCHTGEGRGV